MLLGGGLAGYIFYPFVNKINGNWVSTDQTMHLTSRGNIWELAIADYQQTKGFALVYTGAWEAAGVNKYDGKQVKLLAKIKKANFAKEEIKKLEKKSDLYTVFDQTEKELTLQYTEKGIKQIQSGANLNTVVHMTLENIHWEKAKEKLYLNSSYFSSERIEFTYKNGQ
ncbi:hypothetical protein RV15_GL000145 [Enterococcus silesiacus]|uniref:Uncharacterized protein n=1 Tax=Enterococcus silesiacus TaxID=332949 RepID=A0AA91GDM6_9ENTE|nr:hypothetical protein RV15_GL000145 [Enterococcus silesiacus]